MTTEFQANEVVWGDVPGFGAWQIGHARQHLRYLSVIANFASPIILPDVPLFRVGENKEEVQTWLNTHYFEVHVQLRNITGITGVDFSVVDFTKPDSFYDFVELHNSEHALLDIAFGVA